MIFKQFILKSLGHASYLVGSERTGEALILDARRDVDVYFRTAREEGLRIAYAVDTHQHNDYVTGICELPLRGDVQLLAGARAELGYPVRAAEDGFRLKMGELVFEFMHTPGHTPEHVSLLCTDRGRGDEPALLLSGGALLVGDVARPDLLGGAEETREHARAFCRTLREKILALPDHVEVYPTHVAGSLCGGAIGSRYSTTVGYERRMNRLLANLSREREFVDQCLDLEYLPAVPPYWKRMRGQNQNGPKPLGTLPEPPALTVGAFDRIRQDGAWVIDCRYPEAFGGGHIPGAVNVGLGGSFPTWVGTVLPPDLPYVLVLEESAHLWQACWDLLRIGYDLPQGWLAAGMHGWRISGREITSLPQWNVHELRRHLEQANDLFVVDVRQPAEWAAGHIEGAAHITGAALPDRLHEIPRGRAIAAICGSGYRSSVAASYLERNGYDNVRNVLGGMGAWKAAGFPVV